MLRLLVALDVIRRAGASSAEAALSAFDPRPTSSPAPALDTEELPYASSAEAGFMVT